MAKIGKSVKDMDACEDLGIKVGFLLTLGRHSKTFECQPTCFFTLAPSFAFSVSTVYG